MAEELLEDRVKKLEEKIDRLGELPVRVDGLDLRMHGVERRLGQVELQIVQLRTEMGNGFSAVLEVIDSSSKATQALYDQGRRETRDLLDKLNEDVVETLGTQMRVLHEDLVERIKSLRG